MSIDLSGFDRAAIIIQQQVELEAGFIIHDLNNEAIWMKRELASRFDGLILGAQQQLVRTYLREQLRQW